MTALQERRTTANRDRLTSPLNVLMPVSLVSIHAGGVLTIRLE